MIYSILIITDDVIFPHYFISLLARDVETVSVVVCNSFNDIDSNLTSLDCKLIILDGALNRFSSIEVIHHLRFVRHTTVPIWFFPEVRHEEYIDKSKETGATRIIMKPFDPYLICSEIKTLLVRENKADDD